LVAVELHAGGVGDLLRERIDDGDAALEGDPGDADVRSAADGQTVGQLVADGGVDGEVLQLRPLREEAAAEGVRARPIAGETERRVDADAQTPALADRVRAGR